MNETTHTPTGGTDLWSRALTLHTQAAEELHALSTLAEELTELYGTPSRLDPRQATLWQKVARDAESAERSMDALLALVAEATEART